MFDELTWAPAGFFLVAVGVLTTPFLGLIVILGLLLAALAGVAAAAFAGPYLFGRFVYRRWHARGHLTGEPDRRAGRLETALTARR
jgi:hypothetical protein